MKGHERCSISGSFGAVEIPLLLSFLYLLSEAEGGALRPLGSGLKRPALGAGAIRSEDSVRRGV